MTREEAITILDGFKHNPLFNEQHFEALDMAISALSNKGDSISRQAVLNTLENADKFLDEERTVEKYKALLTECIKVLPSADVRENIHGEWILKKDNLGYNHYICSACKNELGHNPHDYKHNDNFCPNCGCQMDGKENNNVNE